MIAYAWANGRIDFGRAMPKDALPIAKGPAAPLRKHIEVTARHAYDGKSLLVPGVPESGGGDAAVDALLAYSREIKERMDFHARNFGTVVSASKKMQDILAAYLSDYELDDGEGAQYTPSEADQFMIDDAVQGLLADDAFLDALTDWRLLVRARKVAGK